MNTYKLDSSSESLIVARILMLAGFGFTAFGVATDDSAEDLDESSDSVEDDSPAAA